MAENTTVVSSDPAVNMGGLNLNVNPDKAGTTVVTPTEKVTVGGKEVTVTPEVAAALKNAEARGADVDSLTAQVKELSEQLAKVTAHGNKDSNAEVGMDVLLFTQPKEAIAKITAEIEAKLDAKVSQTQKLNEFWTEFYSQNNDLKDFDKYVRYVFQRDYAEMSAKKLTVAAAMKVLSDTVKADFLKIKGPGGKEIKKVVEGAGNPRELTSKEDAPNTDSEESLSTASILKARRAARQAARKPGKT